MHNIKDYESMAKLSLPEDERAWISQRAERLKKSFSELDKMDVRGAAPLVSVLDVKNILREDVAIKIVSRETLLSTSPEQYDGYFQVPKTLD